LQFQTTTELSTLFRQRDDAYNAAVGAAVAGAGVGFRAGSFQMAAATALSFGTVMSIYGFVGSRLIPEQAKLVPPLKKSSSSSSSSAQQH
jgi:hypothetical protein